MKRKNKNIVSALTTTALGAGIATAAVAQACTNNAPIPEAEILLGETAVVNEYIQPGGQNQRAQLTNAFADNAIIYPELADLSIDATNYRGWEAEGQADLTFNQVMNNDTVEEYTLAFPQINFQFRTSSSAQSNYENFVWTPSDSIPPTFQVQYNRATQEVSITRVAVINPLSVVTNEANLLSFLNDEIISSTASSNDYALPLIPGSVIDETVFAYSEENIDRIYRLLVESYLSATSSSVSVIEVTNLRWGTTFNNTANQISYSNTNGLAVVTSLSLSLTTDNTAPSTPTPQSFGSESQVSFRAFHNSQNNGSIIMFY